MRFELEKTWELSRRLTTWANKERMPAKSTTDVGVILNNNSPDKYDSPQEKKWEERWNK